MQSYRAERGIVGNEQSQFQQPVSPYREQRSNTNNNMNSNNSNYIEAVSLPQTDVPLNSIEKEILLELAKLRVCPEDYAQELEKKIVKFIIRMMIILFHLLKIV